MRNLASYPSDQAKEILDSYRKVLFARHPVERLFSAYRSKMTMANGVDKYYTDLALKIAELSSNRTGGSGGRKRLPSLDQFVEYIAREPALEYDLHWKRIVDVCNPCGISYDYIGKVETMDADSKCILENLGMKPWFPKPVERRISSKVDYRAIPEKLRTLLTNIYTADFKLFSYSNG